MARGQLRIVGRDRAGAHHHRIAERAQGVQVDDVLVAGDELRVAGMRGDEAVDALPEVADGDRTCRGGAAQRQVEVEDVGARIAGARRDSQPRPRRQMQDDVWIVAGRGTQVTARALCERRVRVGRIQSGRQRRGGERQGQADSAGELGCEGAVPLGT